MTICDFQDDDDDGSRQRDLHRQHRPLRRHRHEHEHGEEAGRHLLKNISSTKLCISAVAHLIDDFVERLCRSCLLGLCCK